MQQELYGNRKTPKRFFMAHLGTIQPDEKTAPNAIRLNSHKFSKLPKVINEIVCNNLNHLLNNLIYDGHQTTKFMLFHQNVRGLSNKIDEFQIALSPMHHKLFV